MYTNLLFLCDKGLGRDLQKWTYWKQQTEPLTFAGAFFFLGTNSSEASESLFFGRLALVFFGLLSEGSDDIPNFLWLILNIQCLQRRTFVWWKQLNKIKTKCHTHKSCKNNDPPPPPPPTLSPPQRSTSKTPKKKGGIKPKATISVHHCGGLMLDLKSFL